MENMLASWAQQPLLCLRTSYTRNIDSKVHIFGEDILSSRLSINAWETQLTEAKDAKCLFTTVARHSTTSQSLPHLV